MLERGNLPPEFLRFVEENGIDLDLYYSHAPKAYFTALTDLAKSRLCSSPSVAELDWLPFTFAANDQVKVPQSADILPMDAASVLAVRILDPQPHDNVLDLCCAPGMKLALIGRTIGATGTVTGVDLSRHRLATCRSIVKKYKVPNVRLLHCDARAFSSRPKIFTDKPVALGDSQRAFHESTSFRKRLCAISDCLYDRVLVDAQCTHDGSVKHIQKADRCLWETVLTDQFRPDRLDSLYEMQYEILLQGFKMLKAGGVLVYSTCSHSAQQNEQTVGRLLDSDPSSELQSLAVPGLGLSGGSLRISPCLHGCGFLFISKIKKK